jgi:proteic killer suppression protein
MIQSFNCKDTLAIFEGKSPRRFRSFFSVAERKLAQLDAAQTLDFLKAPPGNRLEVLKGDRKVSTVSVSMTSGESVSSGVKSDR